MFSKTPYQQNFFKNKKNFLIVMICSLGLMLAACGGGDNPTDPGNGDEDPPGNGGDDQDRLVSYSQDISPIFSNNCATSGCHDSATKESGVDLSSYDAALNSVGSQYGTEIINPGNPDDSPIVDKIESDPEFGVRMPEDGGSLSPAQIDSIRAWIEDDAPDN